MTHEIYYEKFISAQFFEIDHYTRPVVFYSLPKFIPHLKWTYLGEFTLSAIYLFFFLCKELVTDSFPASKSAYKVFKLAELSKNLSELKNQ